MIRLLRSTTSIDNICEIDFCHKYNGSSNLHNIIMLLYIYLGGMFATLNLGYYRNIYRNKMVFGRISPGRVVNTSDRSRSSLASYFCWKNTCGETDWSLCWSYTPAKALHQRSILGNICLCQVQIRLWNPEETSPEVQNRGISGPTKRI